MPRGFLTRRVISTIIKNFPDNLSWKTFSPTIEQLAEACYETFSIAHLRRGENENVFFVPHKKIGIATVWIKIIFLLVNNALYFT